MRPIRLTLGALGSSNWAPIDELGNPLSIGLGFIPSSGAILTAKVQHTFDNPQAPRAVSVSRAGTVATVVDTGPDGNGHGLSVGDSTSIFNSGSATLDSPNITVASVIDANTYTYTVANSGPTVDNGQTQGLGFRIFDHLTMTGMTTRTDGNYAFNIQAVRLTITVYTGGRADLWVCQGFK